MMILVTIDLTQVDSGYFQKVFTVIKIEFGRCLKLATTEVTLNLPLHNYVVTKTVFWNLLADCIIIFTALF